MCGTRTALEDDWTDVLSKAVRGRGIAPSALDTLAGLVAGGMESLLDGRLDVESLTAAARTLGLHAPSLLALARGEYHPGCVVLPRGMTMFSSDWGGVTVCSYLAWDGSGEAVAFDSGADASGMIRFLRDHGLRLRFLLLTHGHGDHVFEADRIAEKTGASVLVGEGEGIPGFGTFAPGEEFRAGSLLVSSLATAGHSPGGVTYVIRGLDRTVAVVGDALFAGSMGAPNTSYEISLRSGLRTILALPPETILCPGHGPLTTVGLERVHNPFFAGSAPVTPARIILASSSPRRRDLLEQAGFDVEVCPADIEELAGGLPPGELVAANAERKARHVAGGRRGGFVLGADTVVVLDGEILGKPRDRLHAFEMLGRLSGRTHEVLTGVCMIGGVDGFSHVLVESTRVSFRRVDHAAIAAYLEDVDPLDKAGAYAAQDDRGRLIEKIDGSMDNVIGLPVSRVVDAMKRLF